MLELCCQSLVYFTFNCPFVTKITASSQQTSSFELLFLPLQIARNLTKLCIYITKQEWTSQLPGCSREFWEGSASPLFDDVTARTGESRNDRANKSLGARLCFFNVLILIFL